MTGEWIGFAAVIAPAILLGVFFWFRFRARREMQDTIRIALDKGLELSPELIDRLGNPKPPKDRDFRLGIIWVAVALGFALFSFPLVMAMPFWCRLPQTLRLRPIWSRC